MSGVQKVFTIAAIAAICHDANRSLCQQLDDDSQLPWTHAADWQVESAVNGVEFHLMNPHATPEDSHNSWLAQKEAEGWKYGPTKDVGKKEHPCFRPYAELPADQQAKDYLFKSIVGSLAPFVIARPAVPEAPAADRETQQSISDAEAEGNPNIGAATAEAAA